MPALCTKCPDHSRCALHPEPIRSYQHLFCEQLHEASFEPTEEWNFIDEPSAETELDRLLLRLEKIGGTEDGTRLP